MASSSSSSSSSPDSFNALKKEHDELKNRLQCSLCSSLLMKPVRTLPCQHSFCAGCLSQHITSSSSDENVIEAIPKDDTVKAAPKKSGAHPLSSSAPALTSPKREEEDIARVEYICQCKKDIGKLVITEKAIEFRSRRQEQKIPFEDVISMGKDMFTKISFKIKGSDAVVFGPFEGAKRGDVYDAIKAILEEKQKAPVVGSVVANSIALADVKAINDPIVAEIFAAPATAPYPLSVFKDAGEKDTVTVNVQYPVDMKTLFAIVLSDSSEFSRELHTGRCRDLDLEVGKWSKDPSGAFFTRKLTFRKKQKVVSCSVSQVQHLRFHSPTEVFFETQNVMDGVPFSDSFTVNTIWRWKQESEHSTQVNCWVHVDWLKSCFIKGQIDKESIAGTEDYCRHWKLLLLSKFKGESCPPLDAEALCASSSCPSCHREFTAPSDVTENHLLDSELDRLSTMEERLEKDAGSDSTIEHSDSCKPSKEQEDKSSGLVSGLQEESA